MTTRRNDPRTRTAVPCHACGRRSVAPGHILRPLPGDIIEQARKAACGIVSPARLDHLLPLIVEALEGYERENEWLSEQLDLADVDAKRAKEELDAAKAEQRSEVREAACFSSYVERARTMAWLMARNLESLAAALNAGAHWEPMDGETQEKGPRVTAFVEALPPVSFVLNDGIVVDVKGGDR